MTATVPDHAPYARHALTNAACLLGALLFASAAAHAHRPAAKKEAAQASALDFGALAKHRPRRCSPALPALAGPAGWSEAEPLCVWQGRLAMRRWTARSDAPASCTGLPAQWWAWQRARAGIRPGAPGGAWNNGWATQHVAGAAGDLRRIAIVELRGGAWTASEWTWSPSPRAATRAWQQGRWDLLGQAAAKLASADAAAPSQLRAAWEKTLDGRAGLITTDGWRWNSDGKCLRMLPLAASAASLPLPYAREDARLEQRAAMQIQLARRYPQANFVVPFRLLDAPPDARHSGASYIAIWTGRMKVTGQLWIPQKSPDTVVRAQIVADLPARYDTPAGLAAGTGAVRAIERELESIAASWSAGHER